MLHKKQNVMAGKLYFEGITIELVNVSEEITIKLNGSGFTDGIYKIDKALFDELKRTVVMKEPLVTFIVSKQSEAMKEAVGLYYSQGSTIFHGSQPDLEVPLYISLPQNDIELETIEAIQNACGDFMEAMGYELKQQEEPVFGSFFSWSMFKSKNPRTASEIESAFDKGKMAIDLRILNFPAAEVTEKLSNAASQLISSLAGVDEAAIRVGALLILKYENNGNSVIVSETLSPEIMLLLEKNPQLLNSPKTVFNMLQTIKNEQNFFPRPDEVNHSPVEE